MKKVLITRILEPIAKELLAKHFLVDENSNDTPLSKNDLITAVKEYDAILSTISDVFNASVLEKAVRLKAISNYGIGLDNIDVDYSRSKGISVYNLPDVVTNSTADLTFALFLSFIRKIPEARSYVLENRWQYWEPRIFLGEELNGKTFGIIGYGKIGKAVARRALGFGLKVVVYHRSLVTFEDSLAGQIRQAPWDEFLKECDYISLHVPLTNETRDLINMAAIKKMAKKPLLINMARGPIINSDDLIVALEKGYIRGAALDVTSPEPLPSTHPLCMFENCMIIPHIGTATIECRNEMSKKAAENIIKHFSAN